MLKRSEQYQRQVQRADEERRQALATSEALTAVWQKKFEKAEVGISVIEVPQMKGERRKRERETGVTNIFYLCSKYRES